MNRPTKQKDTRKMTNDKYTQDGGMDLDERIELLEDARESIDQAIRLIKGAIGDTGISDYAESYVLPTLTMCARSDHWYLGRQRGNIDDLITMLNGNEE